MTFLKACLLYYQYFAKRSLAFLGVSRITILSIVIYAKNKPNTKIKTIFYFRFLKMGIMTLLPHSENRFQDQLRQSMGWSLRAWRSSKCQVNDSGWHQHGHPPAPRLRQIHPPSSESFPSQPWPDGRFPVTWSMPSVQTCGWVLNKWLTVNTDNMNQWTHACFRFFLRLKHAINVTFHLLLAECFLYNFCALKMYSRITFPLLIWAAAMLSQLWNLNFYVLFKFLWSSFTECL